jgi:hypothetical protein
VSRATFDVGPLSTAEDVAKALIALVRAVGVREVDVREGRMVVDALRTALVAFGAGTGHSSAAPLGARPMTNDEMAYMREHGWLPEGVRFAITPPEFWVTGEPWKPPRRPEN